MRIEQLYPFPVDGITRVVAGYPNAREVAWLQEEPTNMGAWEFARPLLEGLLRGGPTLRYIGRPRSGSPSEGSAAWHTLNQRTIIEEAFELASAPTPREGAVK